MNLKGANLRKGLIRVAAVASLCWGTGVVYLHGEDFCAATFELDDKRVTDLMERYIRSKEDLETLKRVGGKAYSASDASVQQRIDMAFDPLTRIYQSTRPSTRCDVWTTPDKDTLDREGGFYPNWTKRWDFIVLLLGYPLAFVVALAILGAAGAWIAKGFRSAD